MGFSMCHFAAYPSSSCPVYDDSMTQQVYRALPVARLSAVPQFHHLLEEINENPSQVQKINESFSSILD